MNPLFSNLDPYDRLVLIEKKLSHLEHIQNELIHNAEITAGHLKSVSQAISALQNNLLELYVIQQQHTGASDD